ncbi:cache domain-containing protein [Sunxiuqinia indica]|uniref:cache domain-containing protein n=1 Tax=Sunxiuqinia indica TaxID=2692584 RepID=UPI001356D66E|nr:cache domain-containing protein [Sunxiuqinia indica]
MEEKQTIKETKPTEAPRRPASRSITNHIRKIVIVSTLLMTFFVAGIISIQEILIFRDISKQQQEAHIGEHKEFLRDLINIEIEYIASQKRSFDRRLKDRVSENVKNAYRVADKLYNYYQGKMDAKDLKKLIIETVSALNYGNEFMHVFVNDLDGIGVYYPGRPEYTGSNLLDHTDVNGNKVVQRELDFFKDKNQGFINYIHGDKLAITDTIPQNKIVFLKKHNQLNWYFGSKTYYEDYYQEFKNEVAQKVSADHFRYGGYVFINETDGDPVVFEGKPYYGDFNLLDGSDSAKMAVFLQEIEVAKNSKEGGYFTYQWNKIGEEKMQQKISYVKEFPETKWLVGAGFYLDDILLEIEHQKESLRNDLIKNLLVILFVLLLVILGETMVIRRFNSHYFADFSNFTRFFKTGKQSYKKINIDNLYFNEFKEMGEVANEMISERRKVYKQLVLEQKKALESDRLKTAFLANMSHEIRTPMNAILGFSSLLDEENLSEEDQVMYIQLIQKNGGFLLKLINDIIDISKIESDQLSVAINEFQLNELIEELKWNYKDLFIKQKEKEVEFVVENTLPDDFVCTTDKYRLKQVLDNLINNALKFTEKGSVTLKVDKRDKWLHFKVSDTGIGIHEDDKKDIFKRFIQARKLTNKTYGGTGLGLAISENIIHLLGGDIGVKSELGKGSDFYFYIPSQWEPKSK